MRFSFSVAVVLLIPSIGLTAATKPRDATTVRLTLGGIEWTIPRANLGEDIPWYIRAVPGLRHDNNQVMVTFPAETLKQALPVLSGSKNYDGILTVLASREDVARSLSFERKRSEEIWRGEGIFSGAVVEPVAELGLVRVYDRYFSKSREMWQLVESAPQHQAAPPNELSTYRVGACMLMGPSSNRIASCLTRFYVDLAYVDLYISEPDLRWHRSIGAFVAERIRSWRSVAN
jgi:hypothetical protein